MDKGDGATLGDDWATLVDNGAIPENSMTSTNMYGRVYPLH